MSIDSDEIELPTGFYYCKNQNRLDSLLKSKDIDKRKHEIIADIKGYPCILTIDDRILELGKVFIYSISKTDIEKVFKFLQNAAKEFKGNL